MLGHMPPLTGKAAPSRASMKRLAPASWSISAAMIVGISLGTRAQPAAARVQRPDVSSQTRLDTIRRARVWTPGDIASRDLKAGPQGSGAFRPNELVACNYVPKKMSGSSPKFTCALAPGHDVKVKYGHDNGEVYAEVAATRLLWALGFGADHMYPVRVSCGGCPSDPMKPTDTRDHVMFETAAIERKMPGYAIETESDSGWEWPELDLLPEVDAGRVRAERDALKLLAVVMQHTDTKAGQQRLVCASRETDGTCSQPFMIINDLGQTFGHGNLFNRDSIGSVNLKEWARANVWMDSTRCMGNLHESETGTLDRPLIKEAGRKFLSDLLLQLSDTQLRDLFEVARFPQRSTRDIKSATAQQWVDAFKHKRDEIVNHVCPQ